MTSMYDVLKASKGLPVDDIFAELWGRKLSGNYTIATYTGTLPATLTGTKAGYLNQYKIYGNLTQSGTPTPSDPIYPSECGERTENIWTLTATDFSESTVVVGAAKEVTITGLTPNTRYTLASNIRKTDSDASCLWFNGTTGSTNGVWDGQPRTAISSANGELKVYYRSTILPEFNDYWYMLTSGSTAPASYIPYGYRVPMYVHGENWFDGQYPGYAVGSTIKYRPIYVGQGTFTLSTTFPQMTDYADLFFMAGNVSTGGSTGNDGVWSERPITVESIDGYVTVAYRRFTSDHPNLRDYNTMLNLGSTALPYQPYSRTDTPIYLGEVQTTRRIKKLVLTGGEGISYDSAYTRFSLKLPDCLLINVRRTPAFCTHYEVIDDGRTISNVPDNSMYSHNAESRWYIKTTDYSTVDAFKSYLAAQYAAGTPVTIWYILATEETGIVNEPLRKIGNYVDTIDSTQTTTQIPTAAGSTTVSWAGEGLAPSQVELEYERRR